MRRTNIFRVRVCGVDEEERLKELCDSSAMLWNELCYTRRQSFFKGKINWDSKKLYQEYKSVVGSVIAQQIIRKNDEAWRSFFALLRLKKKGKLPSSFRKIKPPGYWKDRRSGKRKLMTVVRNSSYTIEGGCLLRLPRRMNAVVTGEPRWLSEEQGRLEIRYDDLSKRWYAHQTTRVNSTTDQTNGGMRAFVDLGVINIFTWLVEGERQALTFSGRPLLSDWWYWNGKIADHRSLLKTVNKRDTSRRLKELYRVRKRRFRHSIDVLVHLFLEHCQKKSVSRIIVGDVTGIRENRGKCGNTKGNAMVENFWSYRYIYSRLKTTAENYGVEVDLVDEGYTSSICPRCGNDDQSTIIKRKRMFKCSICGLEANRDVVGVVNLAKSITHVNVGGGFNGVAAHPLQIAFKR